MFRKLKNALFVLPGCAAYTGKHAYSVKVKELKLK